jgi:hypothetical protein
MKLTIYLIALMSFFVFGGVNANAMLNSQGQSNMPASRNSSNQYDAPSATRPTMPSNNYYANKPVKLHVSHANIKTVKKVVSKAVKALAKKNYNKFIKTTSSSFKKNITKTNFDKVSNSLNNKLQLKKGYNIQYMTALKQTGVKFYVWKLLLTSGRFIYIKTVIKNDKIDGLAFI